MPLSVGVAHHRPSAPPVPDSRNALLPFPDKDVNAAGFASRPPSDDPERAHWRAAYTAELARVLAEPATSPADSAARLSGLVRTGLLRFEDLREEPSKFFEAHRLLVNHGFEQGPGFSIRFTVQFNLFAGTILELGSPAHLDELRRMQTDGVLGCFALTERLAGVNSGLVVQTVAEWCPSPDRPDGGRFLLRTPHDGARKNWISQGLTASTAVVFADLLVGGVSVGPHAFLIRLRDDDGRVMPGISLEDMGEKTTGNDLDNASIAFHDVWLPRASLLDRHCDVTWDGRYCLESPDAPTNMELIGQRLFTGRVAVAQGAHEFRRRLFRRTRAMTDAKPCWAPGGDGGGAKTLTLSRVPQLRALYDAADAREARTGRFLAEVEAKLCDVLRSGGRPDAGLVEAVAAAKVSAVDEAIEYCHRLRQEVGSYALMAGTGFEHTDFLQCCKFAEGDSRVLMMKVARDRVKEFAELAKTRAPVPPGTSPREAAAAGELAEALARERERGVTSAAALERHWDKAYDLAGLAIENIVNRWVGPVERYAGVSTWRAQPASRL
jgi:acyl-CoA oxidase